MKLVIATKNQGKLVEFKQLLSDLPFEIISLSDYPELPDIEETGETFQENAALKAETVMRFTGEAALADDSGLEVDALDGRPGVYSARFAGAGKGDKANNEKLLAEMAAIAQNKRTARFRSVIAIARPGLATSFADGSVDGWILEAPRGTGGFGYDPLFFFPPAGKTFAEMVTHEKNLISHRSRALKEAVGILREMVASKS